MTKKHYKKIAEMLKGLYERCNDSHAEFISDFVDELADYLQEDNKLFDRARFYNACGIIPPEDYDKNAIS